MHDRRDSNSSELIYCTEDWSYDYVLHSRTTVLLDHMSYIVRQLPVTFYSCTLVQTVSRRQFLPHQVQTSRMYMLVLTKHF